MAVRRSGSESGARSGAMWAAVWVAVLAAVVAMLGGVSRLGVVEPFDVPQLAAALGAIALTLVLPRSSRRLWRSAQARRIEGPALAVLVAIAVSAALASDRVTAVVGAPGSGLGAGSLAALVLLALGAAWLAPRVRAALVSAAPWIAAAEIALTVWQMVTGAVPHGTFSNATYLSMALVMLLPPTLAPAVGGDRLHLHRSAIVRLVVGTAIVVVLAAAGARVGAVVALAGAAWMLTPPIAAMSRNDRRVMPAVAGAVVLTVLVAGFVASRFLGGAAIADELGTRPEMWSGAARLVAMRPVFGWGPDAFHVAIGRVADVSMMTKEGSGAYGFGQLPTDPHDVVLAMLVAIGVAGAAALAWAAGAAVRTWLNERRSSGRLAWPAVSTVLFFATALMAPATLQDLPLFALVAGASVPLGYLRSDAASGKRTVAMTAGAAAAWAVRTFAVPAALVSAAMAVTHLYVGSTGQAATVASSLRARDAAALWQVDPFLYYEESVRWSLAGAAGTNAALAPSVTAAERAIALAPMDPFYLGQYAYVRYVSGEFESAATAYAAVLRVFPNSPDAVEGVGFSLLAGGSPDRAKAYAARALELGPGRFTAHKLASEVYRALGDEKRAAAEAAIADKLAPK